MQQIALFETHITVHRFYENIRTFGGLERQASRKIARQRQENSAVLNRKNAPRKITR